MDTMGTTLPSASSFENKTVVYKVSWQVEFLESTGIFTSLKFKIEFGPIYYIISSSLNLNPFLIQTKSSARISLGGPVLLSKWKDKSSKSSGLASEFALVKVGIT